MKKLLLSIENDLDYDLVRVLLNRLQINFEEVQAEKKENYKSIDELQIPLDSDKMEEIDSRFLIEEISESDSSQGDFIMTSEPKNFSELPLKSNESNKRWDFDFSPATIKLVIRTVKLFQKKYFDSGEQQDIVPMTLENIADIVGRDISSISRILDSKKYAINGVRCLYKDLFSSHDFATIDGECVSKFKVLHIIKHLIEIEDKIRPINDQEIENELRVLGYIVARRTIAKYRENDLKIPVARHRKLIYSTEVADNNIRFKNQKTLK